MTTTITVLATETVGGLARMRYRIEGGQIDPEWMPRDGAPWWCEFTIYGDDDQLASYGGTVWPLAWPALFEALPSSPYLGSSRVRLTANGRAALGRNEEASL